MRWLTSRLLAVAERRKPDFVIGSEANPYLLRWWVIPRNKVFNIYLHNFRRSDDDRALHDHPWVNCSVLLVGDYVEHTIAAGGVNVRKTYRAGDVKFRRAKSAHRVELQKQLVDCRCAPASRPYCSECAGVGRTWAEVPVWTLFITGPVVRDWGFHCPAGWRFWEDFVSKCSGGNDVGRGCGD